ncbi:MAG: hypothetical protein HYY92_02280 [Parcubacteria group bacterium]|nr:hypothetical protein [Parcubacteria group bacterium]
MSFEKSPTQAHSSEKGPETAPTVEEVRAIFEKLSGEDVAFEEVRMREDAEGLYLWDIKIAGEDGETKEYSYMRKGRYPEGQALRTAVHVTFFDADGMPTGGHSVAHFENGAWNIPA